MNDFPRTHDAADSPRDPKITAEPELRTRTSPKKNHLRVDMQRHRHEERSKSNEYAWLMPSVWPLMTRSGHFEAWKRMGQNPRSSWSLPSA